MNSKPLVSVCMITYNHEEFIQEAIEGVLLQKTNFDIEVVISNDCSTDRTDSIIRALIQENKDISFRYTFQNQNIGMMPNFIFALKECKGKYIALCEGDDYWTDPLKLQKQVDFLEGNPDYSICFHKIKILKSNGDLVDDFITTVPENHENQETLARFGNYIHTPSVVFRNVIQIFPPEFTLTPIGDYFLYMILSDHGKLKYMEEEMAVYREGVGIWSTKSTYYRYLNTALMHALLVNVFVKNKNMLIVNIFLKRIQSFIERFESQLVVEDLCKLSTHVLVTEIIFKRLVENNNILKCEATGEKTSRELLETVLTRVKKRIWKK